MMLAAVHSVWQPQMSHDEAPEQRLALLGVRHFRMELHAIPALGLVRHRRDRDARRSCR